MPLEEVDKLMQDNADAKAYADSLNQMLGGEALTPACRREAKGCNKGWIAQLRPWQFAMLLHCSLTQ